MGSLGFSSRMLVQKLRSLAFEKKRTSSSRRESSGFYGPWCKTMGNWCSKETTQLLKLNVPIMHVWDPSFWSLTFIWQDSISLPGLVGFTGPTSCLTLLLIHEDSQGFFLWLAKIHSRGWPESSFQLKSLGELDISSIQKKSTQRLGEGKKNKASLHPSNILVSTNTRSQSTKLSHDLRLFILSQLRASHSLRWGTRKPTPCGSTMFHQPKKPYKCRPCCHLPSVRQYAGQCLKPGLMSAMVQANGLAPGFTTPTMDIAFLPVLSSSKFMS